MTDEKKLIDVRCPFSITAKESFHRRGQYIKAGQQYPCNILCVRVYAPSSGETKCPRCNLFFEFDVVEQSKVATKINVQPHK